MRCVLAFVAEWVRVNGDQITHRHTWAKMKYKFKIMHNFMSIRNLFGEDFLN